jgi:hypothetical protein
LFKINFIPIINKTCEIIKNINVIKKSIMGFFISDINKSINVIIFPFFIFFNFSINFGNVILDNIEYNIHIIHEAIADIHTFF